MKRIFSIFMLLAILCSSAFLFSCKSNQGGDTEDTDNSTETTEHKHIYTGSWIATADGHYRVSTCHPDLIEPAKHMDTVDIDGSCDVCHYVLQTPTTFSVSVKDGEGNPLSGVTVRIYNTSSDATVTTDENGAASCQFIYFDTVRAIIKGVPEGYESYTDALYTFEGESLEITLN